MLSANEDISKGIIDRLSEMSQAVYSALSGTQSYLHSRFSLVSDSDEKVVGGGWGQFLDEHNRPPSVNGTSHGLISLIAN